MNDIHELVRAIATGCWLGLLTSVEGLPKPWNWVMVVFSISGIIFTWLYKRKFDRRPLYERRHDRLRK